MIAVPVLAKAKKEVECHIRRISIDGFSGGGRARSGVWLMSAVCGVELAS